MSQAVLFQVLPCPANCSALFGTPDLAGVFTTAPPLNPCHPHPASPPTPPQSHNNHQTLHQSLSPFSTVISLIVTLPGSCLSAKCWTCPPECQILGSSKKDTQLHLAKSKCCAQPKHPNYLNNPDFSSGIQYKSHIPSSVE